MIGKPNPIKAFLNRSLRFALPLYQELVSDHLVIRGLLRLPVDSADALKMESYEPYSDFAFEKREGGYFFHEAGIVETQPVCEALTRHCTLLLGRTADHLNHDSDGWELGGIRARRVVLATGADLPPFTIPDWHVKSVWGQRIEVRSDNEVPYNFHKKISLSASRHGGSVAIGATHVRGGRDLLISESDSERLLQDAMRLFFLQNPEIIAIYAGNRAASHDYLPLVGPVVDHAKTVHAYPKAPRGRAIPPEGIAYHEGLYLLNGLGARGFVYGPYCGYRLARHILGEENLPPEIALERRYRKWIKKTSSA